MNKVTINGVEVFPFSSREQLMDYVDKNKSILIAINAEKVMNATDQTRAIINSNIRDRIDSGETWQADNEKDHLMYFAGASLFF